MSTLGKVLTFLNVIAAILLFVIAGKDYGEARAQRFSAFRHELVIIGLPVDNEEFSPEYPDDPVAEKLTTDVLTEVFKGADGGQDLGGSPVKTVVEELDRVKTKVTGNLNGAGAQAKKKLQDYLLNHARDVKERDALKKIAEEGNVAAGLAELDKRFAEVKAKLASGTGKNRQDLRYAAARLFVDLSTDKAWLERVRVVCGLDPVAAALDHSAHTGEQLKAGVDELMIKDQGDFLAEYNSRINQLQYEHENLYEANKKLAELKALVAKRQTEVAQRTTEVERNRAELTALTGATSTEVGKLEAIQRDLFNIQQRLGQAQDEVQKLEQQLRLRANPGR